MYKLIRLFFGTGGNTNKKRDELMSSSSKVGKAKRKYNHGMLDIKKKARIIREEAEQMIKTIDTATATAIILFEHNKGAHKKRKK